MLKIRHRRPVLLALLALALAALAGCGRPDDQPSIVMHRQRAGVRNADGWYPATSTEGGFSVLMPVPFNDFTVVTRRPDGASVRSFVLGTRSKEGVKFSVAGTAWQAPRPDLAAFAAGFRGARQMVSDPEYGEVSGHPCVTVVVTRPDTVTIAREIVAPGMVFTLTVEYAGALRDTAGPVAGIFLDSFRYAAPATPPVARP